MAHCLVNKTKRLSSNENNYLRNKILSLYLSNRISKPFFIPFSQISNCIASFLYNQKLIIQSKKSLDCIFIGRRKKAKKRFKFTCWEEMAPKGFRFPPFLLEHKLPKNYCFHIKTVSLKVLHSAHIPCSVSTCPQTLQMTTIHVHIQLIHSH